MNKNKSSKSKQKKVDNIDPILKNREAMASINIAIMRAKKKKETQRVILEGEFIHIVTESNYQAAYREYCNNTEWNMSLIYTAVFRGKKYDGLKAAKQRAIENSDLWGGQWHVTKYARRKYVEVTDRAIIRAKNQDKVVFSYDSGKEVTKDSLAEYLKKEFPNMNREQRRKLLNLN